MNGFESMAMQEIDRRSERAKRLLVKMELPAGLDWEAFLSHEDIEDLDLDFITACEMFKAYEKLPAKEASQGG